MTGCLPALAKRLTDATIGIPIVIGRLPDQPDAVVVLIERPATSSKDFDAHARPALETFRVQLIARAGKDDGIAAAEATAWIAYRALVGRHLTITVGTRTERYDWIHPQHAPAHTGVDTLDRPLVTTNLAVQRHGDLAPDA